jgi:hypothetical protein
MTKLDQNRPKSQIERVFGVVGSLAEGDFGHFVYWYRGLPAKAKDIWPDSTYRTVICNSKFDGIPGVIEEDDVKWVLSTVFESTGEAPCEYDSLVQFNQTIEKDGHHLCRYCEAPHTAHHRTIYLGNNWVEAVYHRV